MKFKVSNNQRMHPHTSHPDFNFPEPNQYPQKNREELVKATKNHPLVATNVKNTSLQDFANYLGLTIDPTVVPLAVEVGPVGEVLLEFKKRLVDNNLPIEKVEVHWTFGLQKEKLLECLQDLSTSHGRRGYVKYVLAAELLDNQGVTLDLILGPSQSPNLDSPIGHFNIAEEYLAGQGLQVFDGHVMCGICPKILIDQMHICDPNCGEKNNTHIRVVGLSELADNNFLPLGNHNPMAIVAGGEIRMETGILPNQKSIAFTGDSGTYKVNTIPNTFEFSKFVKKLYDENS